MSSSSFLPNQNLLLDTALSALKASSQVDITSYPCSRGLDILLKEAEERVEKGGFSSPKALLAWLKKNEEEYSFIHGDCCLPRFLRDDGEIGRSGIGDRYNDIAL